MKAISRLSRHSSHTSRHSLRAGSRPAGVDRSTPAEPDPSRAPAVNLSPWRREPLPPARTRAGRAAAWARSRRTPLVAGALSVALMGALVGGAFRMPVSAEASQPGATFQQTTPGSGTDPAFTGTSGDSVTRFAAVAEVSPLTRSGGWLSTVGTSVTLSVGGWTPVGVASPDGGPLVLAGGPSLPAGGAGSAAGSTGGSQPSGATGATGSSGAAGGGTSYPVVVTRPGGAASAPTAPSAPGAPPSGPAPVVAAPAAPLTSAQQTAANASAAAALTAANAKADADLTAANALAAANLTAANAAAAADLTAANAAAAAAATAEAAAAAAWATAHPQG